MLIIPLTKRTKHTSIYYSNVYIADSDSSSSSDSESDDAKASPANGAKARLCLFSECYYFLTSLFCIINI